MNDDKIFIKEIQITLRSALEVEDWITIKEILHEIMDHLGQFEEDDYDLLDN